MFLNVFDHYLWVRILSSLYREFYYLPQIFFCLFYTSFDYHRIPRWKKRFMSRGRLHWLTSFLLNGVSEKWLWIINLVWPLSIFWRQYILSRAGKLSIGTRRSIKMYSKPNNSIIYIFIFFRLIMLKCKSCFP